jgi:hypothetical protein
VASLAGHLPTSFGEDRYYRLGPWLEEDKPLTPAAGVVNPRHSPSGLLTQQAAARRPHRGDGLAGHESLLRGELVDDGERGGDALR